MILFVATVSSSWAQKTLSNDYSYKLSEPYKVFDAKEKIYFAKGNEVMALKLDGKEVLIQKFDSDKPAFVKEKKYEKYFPKNYSIEQAMEIDGKYYFFYSSWDGDNDKEQLFAVEIDFASGEFVGSPKLVFQVDGKVAGTLTVGGMGFSYSVEDKFDFFQSRDKKKVLIQYRRKPEVKNDTKSFDIIGMFAYDGNLNKISGNEVTMPYTERRMNNLDYQLDSKGNLYLLTKVFHDDSNDDKKKRKDTEANYHIEMFVIKQGSDKIEISKFDNKDKFISKLWLFDTDKDFLVCGGFYSNGKGDFDDCDGLIAFKIKEDGSIYDKTFHEIPLEVLNQYESERTKKKNEKKERKGDDANFSDLELNDLVVNSDGSIVLVGEQYFTITHTSYSPQGGYRSYTTYHYCDMLVSKINADGSLGWMKKIAKNQIGGAGRGGMSYKYFNSNNYHYIVYLDNVKNIDLPLDKAPARHTDGKGGYLTAVKISDSDGALTKGSILNAREVGDFQIYQFSTNRIVKTSENTFVLEVYKKKKEDIMIKVDLK
ncbi:hypothetical protein [Flavobacterium humi]|uniref:Uncharacterized protein n=1 Tax=Flavobacterium humi TaxID=2562683 RepID=A0A4Z0L743_9FLAO|nr:hypothetical protein [Flavobacterium humi]TGD57599.1 hypothetical protein E4635_10435 [Flavobacterium humi]